MGKSVARVTRPVPPLREGDRMDLREFFRRYEAAPEGTRAELINGVVYIKSRPDGPGWEDSVVPPISTPDHGRPHARLIGWLITYEARTPGVESSAPGTVRFPSASSAPEPDAFLRILPECGGRTTVGKDGYLVGPPELVIEVAYTRAGIDLGPKMDMFRADGVKEYLVWRTYDGIIDWFVLRHKKYDSLVPGSDGVLRSVTFPGLWLDAPALLGGNLARMLEVVQQGIASPEHAAFVAKLQAAARRRKRR